MVPVKVRGQTKYAVISGNGRSAGIKEAYAAGSDKAAAYSDFARSKDNSSNHRQPVYVGVLDPTEVDLHSFAREANESATAQMSATEQARTDAEKLSPTLMNSFVPSETGEIHNAANREFIRGFLNTVPAKTDVGQLVTSDGSLSQVGITRVKNALFARAFGDSERGLNALARMSESVDSNVRNLTNALLKTAPKFAAFKSAAMDGTRFKSLDISSDVPVALEKLSSLKAEGMSVDDFIRQGNLFGTELTPLQTRLLQAFEVNSRSAKAVGTILDNYLAGAEAAGDPHQSSLFGASQNLPVAEELFKAAVENYEQTKQSATAATQTALFDAGGGRANQRLQRGNLSSLDSGATELNAASLAAQAAAFHKERDRLEKLAPEDLYNEARSKGYKVTDYGIELSPAHTDIIRRIQALNDLAMGRFKPDDSVSLAKHFRGLHSSVENMRQVAIKLQSISERSPKVAWLAQFGKDLYKEAKLAGSSVIYTTENPLTKYHEKGHQATEKGSNNAEYENRVALSEAVQRPEFAKIRQALGRKNYDQNDPGLLVEEAIQHIQAGQLEDVGLTKEEGDNFARWYYNSFAEQGHNLDIPEFDRAAYNTREVLNDVRQKRRSIIFRGEESTSQSAGGRNVSGGESESSSENTRLDRLGTRQNSFTDAGGRERAETSQLQARQTRLNDSLGSFLRDATKADKSFGDLAKEINQLPAGKRAAVAEALSPLIENERASAAEIIVALRRAGLLTGIRTHAKNILSNTAFQVSEEASRPLAAVVDMALSAYSGERTVEGLNPAAFARSVRAVFKADAASPKSGLASAYEILKNGDTKENLEKQQIKEIQTGMPLVDTYLKVCFRTLSAEDALFKSYAVRRSLEDQAKTIARNERKKDATIDVKARAQELLEKPTQAMQANATADAEFATFQNDNFISSGIRDAKKSLNRSAAGSLANTAFEMVVPFDRTPTNIVLRTLEYSPLGFVKNIVHAVRAYNGYEQVHQDDVAQATARSSRAAAKLDLMRARQDAVIEQKIEQLTAKLKEAPTLGGLKGRIEAKIEDLKEEREIKQQQRNFNDFTAEEKRNVVEENLKHLFTQTEQREFARTFGRAALGSGLMTLGFFLAAKGLMSGILEYEPDLKDEYLKRAQAGIANGSILIPNVGRFVAMDSPAGKVMALGATLYEQMHRPLKKGEDAFAHDVAAIGKAGWEAIRDQPLLNTATDYLTGDKTLTQRAGEFVGGFVPTIVNDAAEVLDDKSRKATAKKGSSLADQFITPIEKRIPGVRTRLDESENTVSEAERGGMLRRALRAVDPLNTRSPEDYQFSGATKSSSAQDLIEKARSGADIMPDLRRQVKDKELTMAEAHNILKESKITAAQSDERTELKRGNLQTDIAKFKKLPVEKQRELFPILAKRVQRTGTPVQREAITELQKNLAAAK